MDTNNSNKRARAAEKIKQIKGFYIHLTIYVIMNITIFAINMIAQINNGWEFYDALFFFGNLITPIAWGIGLFFHGAKVFGFSPFFSKDWEERQIKKYLDEEKKEYEKYK
tara:strand:- start:206 stop:535 length:330 start_codon:yes stop_codon:yes gene_type:complete